MEPVTFKEGCGYAGGFAGMQPSESATLRVDDEGFELRRPRVFLKRSVTKLWARWPAVVGLRIDDADGGARLFLTTKARGTGEVTLTGHTVDELWELFDGIADLKERLHEAPQAAEVEADTEVEAGAEAKSDSGTDAEAEEAN